MDNKKLGELLSSSLSKYKFKKYGNKLFYLNLKDSIIILNQSTYLGCAELYLDFIIKECHPEIITITKNTLKDKMLIDSYDSNKLLYRFLDRYEYNFYNIPENKFDLVIDDFYNEFIKPFEVNLINGIENYNRIAYKELYGYQAKIYKDSAEKIGHKELAAYRGHDWLLSDYYILVNEYNIDSRFVNDNTERYIMENVIKKIPSNLNGKDITKWCNDKCKEIFISRKYRKYFGYGIVFPFIDGKPLKFYGIDKLLQVYINEETNEIYHCKIIEKKDNYNIKYELYKVK